MTKAILVVRKWEIRYCKVCGAKMTTITGGWYCPVCHRMEY